MQSTILALGVMLSAFLLGLVFGGPYIRLLRRFGIGQNIRREGPTRDFAKQGIPTMGGGLFIAVVAFLWAFVVFLMPDSERSDFIPQTIVPIGALVGVGALGAIDDFVNVKYGFGIRGRHKLVWQTIVAIAAAIGVSGWTVVTSRVITSMASIATPLAFIFGSFRSRSAIRLDTGQTCDDPFQSRTCAPAPRNTARAWRAIIASSSVGAGAFMNTRYSFMLLMPAYR